MPESPITVTYSLEEILTRLEKNMNERFSSIDERFSSIEKNMNERFSSIEGKIDGLQKEVSEIRQKDLADLKVGQARVEERLTGLETRLDSTDKRIEKIENTQKNQVWTMITLLGGSLITVALRFFLTSNNP